MQNVPKGDDAGNAPALTATWRELAAGMATLVDTFLLFASMPMRTRVTPRHVEETVVAYSAVILRAHAALIAPSDRACGVALHDVDNIEYLLRRASTSLLDVGDVPPVDDGLALTAGRVMSDLKRHRASMPPDPGKPRTDDHRTVNRLRVAAARISDGPDIAERRAAVALLYMALHPSFADASVYPARFFTDRLVVACHDSRNHRKPDDAARGALELLGLGAMWKRVLDLESKRHVRAVRKRQGPGRAT